VIYVANIFNKVSQSLKDFGEEVELHLFKIGSSSDHALLILLSLPNWPYSTTNH
jgi:hypothetical protein